jgi:hypothetical protein
MLAWYYWIDSRSNNFILLYMRHRVAKLDTAIVPDGRMAASAVGTYIAIAALAAKLHQPFV